MYALAPARRRTGRCQPGRIVTRVITIVENILALVLVIAVGWLLRRTGVLGPAATDVLANLVYWAATPALLFSVISTTPIADVMGKPLAVAAVSGVVTAATYAAVARFVMRAGLGELVLGSMSASLNNAAYIGIPVAIYVLGQAHYGVPVIIFQLGFLSPTFFVLADLVGAHGRITPAGVAKRVATNPMVIAAALGLVCSLLRLHPPAVVSTTTSMLGDAAAPTVLVAFGASLLGQRFSAHTRQGRLIGVATGCKLLLQPMAAAVAGVALGLTGRNLMGVVVMAGLPTAQNAFIAATRARVGQDIAKGVVLLTTFGSLPLTILTSWVFLH